MNLRFAILGVAGTLLLNGCAGSTLHEDRNLSGIGLDAGVHHFARISNADLTI